MIAQRKNARRLQNSSNVVEQLRETGFASARVTEIRTCLEQLNDSFRMLDARAALALRDKLLPLIPDARSRGYRCLADWDGDYSVDSEGALLFESLLYHFALALRGGDNIEVYTANWDPRSLIVADVMFARK